MSGFWEQLLGNDDDGGIFGSQHGSVLAGELDDLITAGLPGDQRTQVELGDDSQLTNHLHNRNFNKRGQIGFGKVVYVQPYTHWYRVLLDDMDGEVSCCRLSEASTTPFSVRDTSPYAPNTNVIVWVSEEGLYGIILGAVPDKVEDGGLIYPDWISQGSNVGFKREAYFKETFDLLENEGDVIDFSNGRPLDALASGEWGRMSDLGLGIFLDNFMAYLRADETCGVWFFYLDRLARLAGHNLDIRSAISELMIRDDNGEGLNVHGFTCYPWEAMGAFEFGQTQIRDETDLDVHYSKPYARLEPAQDDQAPFYRLEEFRGYLGQAFMRHVSLPSAIGSSGVNTYSNSLIIPGVFREQIGLDGSYGLESAHSISIFKRAIIPIPKRAQLPEAPAGDDADEGSYNFAGLFGGGDGHKIGSPTPTVKNGHLQEATSLSDFLAYLFEWKGLHPFHYHKRDFELKNQSGANPNIFQIQAPPSFSSLLNDTYTTPPTARTQKVDHRYGDVSYYETTSGLALLPQGSVVLRGGAGEEIRMVGGSIVISCPGDVWLQPGRNVNVYAGDDFIARARNSMDFTTTQHDIRFKAERNMEFLAGNSQSGGRMLFENKSPGAGHDVAGNKGEDLFGSGFVFKAKHSQFITAVSEIYLRTGGGSGDDAIDEGPITLDASKGKSDINTVSRAFVSHMELLLSHTFPVEGAKDVANNYSAQNAQIQTSLQLDGGLAITKNGLLMKGDIAVLGGHIGTEKSEKFKGLVGVLKDESLKKTKKALGEVGKSMGKFQEAMADFFTDGIEKRYYEEDTMPGNETFQNASAFSLRTEAQMNTANFEFAETYWQQIAEATGDIPGKWTESVVKYQGEEMMPHPGKKKWSEEPTWQQIELVLHDPKKGTDADRGAVYEDFNEYQGFDLVTPDGAYPVVSV